MKISLSPVINIEDLECRVKQIAPHKFIVVPNNEKTQQNTERREDKEHRKLQEFKKHHPYMK